MTDATTRPAAATGAAVLPRLELAVFALALGGLVWVAPGGPGWGAASARAVVAVGLDRAASAPLYGLLGSVAAWLPVGEPGFRLAALNAALAALALAGVVAAVRALVPRLPVAGAVGALLLLLAPPLHEASGPSLLAAAGAVWAVVGVLRGRPVLAFAGCAAALGGEPWLGVILLVAVTAALALRRPEARGPRPPLPLFVAVIGGLAVALWIGAVGGLPGCDPDLGAVLATTGRGAGAIVVGAGLLGAAFAAATGLAGARQLLAAIALAGAHAMLVADPSQGSRGTPLLVLLAIGAALIPVAIVRAAAPAASGHRALAITAGAGLPLLAVALVAGAPQLGADRKRGDAPARVAHALIDELPAGPGVALTTRETSSLALAYAHALAGARPDLSLVPPLPPEQADVIAVSALRAHEIAGGDVPAVGRMDLELARPRGRGFEMLLDAPRVAIELPREPARYGDGDGAREAVAEALERARYEASTGRLDQAARALGLAARFGAADLAVLAATRPGPERPALYDFVPALGAPGGAWQLDLFGDDLAWVGGIAQPELPPTAPAARRLHALWRSVLAGKITGDDVRIAALGADATRATTRMLHELRPSAAGSGSGSGSGDLDHTNDKKNRR